MSEGKSFKSEEKSNLHSSPPQKRRKLTESPLKRMIKLLLSPGQLSGACSNLQKSARTHSLITKRNILTLLVPNVVKLAQ